MILSKPLLGLGSRLSASIANPVTEDDHGINLILSEPPGLGSRLSASIVDRVIAPDDSLAPEAITQAGANHAPAPLDLLDQTAASALPVDSPLVSFNLVDCEVSASSVLDLGASLTNDALACTAVAQVDESVPSPSV